MYFLFFKPHLGNKVSAAQPQTIYCESSPFSESAWVLNQRFLKLRIDGVPVGPPSTLCHCQQLLRQRVRHLAGL